MNEEENGGADPDTATLSKKFSFFEKGGGENGKKESEPVTSERLHAAKECKASSVINKFKDLEKRAANGEDDYGKDSVSRSLIVDIFLRLKLFLSQV